MRAEQIERLQFSQYDEPQTQLRNELATKAKDKLGYSYLATAISTPGSLLAALRKHKIQPLNPYSVDEYKLTKVQHHLRRSTVVLSASWGLLLLSVVGCVKLWLYAQSLRGELAFWTSVILWCISLFILCPVTFSSHDKWRTPRKITTWQRVSLYGFQAAVPEFVLEKALTIKEDCPTVSFYIDQLITKVDAQDARRINAEKDAAILRRIDPFLVAQLNDEEYYIEVWNERAYERTL